MLVDKGAQLHQIKQDAEQLSIAQNVDIKVVTLRDEKWVQVNERYSFKIKASDYGYTLSDVTTTLAVQSDKKADFVKLLQTLTSGDIPLVDIPDTITFTGQYINPTTKTSTTDKAVAIAEKSGYTDIEISLVRKNKTVWVARSEVKKGHRKTLSGSLSGYKTHPLSSVESNDNLVVGHLQIIHPNKQNEFSADEKATDEAGNAWRYITAGSVNNVEIKGWIKTTQDNVKWVSPWQWPGFTQIDEQTTLAEQRLIQIQAQEQETVPETTQASVDPQTTTSNIADAYQGSALLTHVLAIIQNLSVDGQAQALNDKQLKAALLYPWLAQRFGHTLVKYQSEWYSEIDSECNMPKWEALNEQLNGDVKVYLDFLNDESSKSQALALLQQNYTTRYQEQAKITELLAKDDINLSGFESLKRRANGNNKICQDLTTAKSCLETHINAWEQEKARIKASLWWDEVAKKLAAKQAAQTKESEAAKVDQQPLPSLSVDGKAWFLHPVGMMGFVNILIVKNYTVNDAKEALRIIYHKYGKEMAIIIERMYRSETAHFTSQQYKRCGTGGMEVFGKAPYYGWDTNFFSLFSEHTPIGVWSSYENEGMSGKGGNAQIVDKKKQFLILPTVLAGMEYKAVYINKYNGNWARWHSKDSKTQEVYKTHIENIKPKFIDEFEKENK